MDKEFADFLCRQAPFDLLGADDLERLTARAEVEAFASGSIVLAENRPVDHFWVVRSGAVEVLDRGDVVDLLGPGDALGYASVLSGVPVAFTFRATEDSVCLRIPDPRRYLAHPERLRFTLPGVAAQRAPLLTDAPAVHIGQPMTRLMRPVVWCRSTDRVRDVARLIGTAAQSCALVAIRGDVGIVTDRDFRHRVATGDVSVDAPVAELATIPALTIDEDATEAECFLRMIEHGVHHLVVTDEAGRAVGVVRVVDLASAQVRSPLVVRSAIESAQSLDALAQVCSLLPATIVELHDEHVPAPMIGSLVSAVVDAIVRRVHVLRKREAAAVVAHSWVVLGSQARREPLPRSDIDTAIVWADPPDSPDPPADLIRFVERVLDGVESCGLRRCPDGANANNPLFCRSRSAWIDATTAWLGDPTRPGALLLSAVVADSRPVTDLALGRSMTDAIRARTRTAGFLRALLAEAVAPKPPIGFVRDFVVHHSGEHQGELDLKKGGLTPIVALGRWIAITTGDNRGTTPQRLSRGANADLLTQDEADTLVGAFEGIYGLIFDHETQAIRSGAIPSTFIAPKDLDTLTRRHLRESFRAVALIQGRVEQEWRLRLAG
jgi:CBS domain-containing protein